MHQHIHRILALLTPREKRRGALILLMVTGVEMVAYGVVLLGLVGLLVAIDPLLAAVVTAVLGGVYGAIYAAARGVLGRIGRDRVHAKRRSALTTRRRLPPHPACGSILAHNLNIPAPGGPFGRHRPGGSVPEQYGGH